MGGVTHSLTQNNKAFQDLTKKIIPELNGGFVKSGFPQGAPVGEAKKMGSGHWPYGDMSEVARIAVWNEYGTPTSKHPIPPRPFFRNAINENRKQIADKVKYFSNLAVIGKITAAQAFENLGLYMQSIIRGSIKNTTSPKNADSTIAKKGSSHPLIDSGQMINSVTFVKVTGKESSGKGVEV